MNLQFHSLAISTRGITQIIIDENVGFVTEISYELLTYSLCINFIIICQKMHPHPAYLFTPRLAGLTL